MSDNLYLEKAERDVQKMHAFRRQYEAMHPLPVRQEAVGREWYVYTALAAMVIASVIVSASHTIPIFSGSEPTLVSFIVGVSAFIMLEVGIVSLTYIRTRTKFKMKPHQAVDVNRWLTTGLFLAFGIAIVANVHSTLRAVGATFFALDVILAIAVGLSAPVLAFVCGDVLALIAVEAQVQQQMFDIDYVDACADYDERFVASWHANKRRWGVQDVVVTVEAEPVTQIRQLIAEDRRPDRPSPKLQKALDFLSLPENEGYISAQSRDLEPVIGVSHMTINKAQNILKSRKEKG